MSEVKTFSPQSDPATLCKWWAAAYARKVVHARAILKVQTGKVRSAWLPRFMVVSDDDGNIIGVQYDNGSMPNYCTTLDACEKADKETGEMVPCGGTAFFQGTFEATLEVLTAPLSDTSQKVYEDLMQECKHQGGLRLALMGADKILEIEDSVKAWHDGKFAAAYDAAYQKERRAVWPAYCEHLAKQAKREAQAKRQKAALKAAEARKAAAEVRRIEEDKELVVSSLTLGNLARKVLGRLN